MVLVAIITSCKKEVIVPNYEFRQHAFLWGDTWSSNDTLYPVLTYQIAIMADQPFDEVNVNMTIVLNDSTRTTVTREELMNFGQLGFYNPDYEYPKYWIATIMDTKGICDQMYGFDEDDVYGFEFEANVRIGEEWYTVPLQKRGKNDLWDPFWI